MKYTWRRILFLRIVNCYENQPCLFLVGYYLAMASWFLLSLRVVLRNFELHVSVKFWQLLANHRRPKLTIRGNDQILNDLCTRIEWEVSMLHTGPLRIRALSSTKHCMKFKTTKDKIAQWNKMLHFGIKLRKFTHLVWFLLSIWPIWSFWGAFQMFVAASKVSKIS